MKLFLSALMVVGAILMANSISCMKIRRSLEDYCEHLEKTLSKSSVISSNSEATYKLADWLIRSVVNVGLSDRALLADAWKAVTYNETCIPKSLEFVEVIHACGPFWYQSLGKTLGQDTVRYAKKCFPDVAKLDDVLQVRLKDSSGDDSTEVTRFLDEEFIANYQLNNLGERRSFYVNSGCCRPVRSEESLRASIKRCHEVEDISVFDYYKQNPKKLSTFLEKNLIKPCEKYVKRLKPLMNTVGFLEFINYVEKSHLGLDGLSENFQHAIFRYKYCKDLERSSSRRIVKMIAVKHFT